MEKTKLEFKVIEKKHEDVAKISIHRFQYDGVNLEIAIKTNVYHNKFFFTIDEYSDKPEKRKYDITKSDNKKISVKNPLEIIDKHSDLKFYFGYEGTSEERIEHIFNFIIPIVHLNKEIDLNKIKRKLRFQGLLGKGFPRIEQNETEEGIIIFEPD